LNLDSTLHGNLPEQPCPISTFRKRLANWFLRRAKSSGLGKRTEEQDWHPFLFFLMLSP